MSSGLDSLIARIEAASKRAAESPDSRDKRIQIGEFLLHDVCEQNPSVSSQEAVVTKWVNIITAAVNGFSDYTDCFWEMNYFFQLLIEKYSPKTALQTVKAGKVMFNTEASSDRFEGDWAAAAVKRCAGWVKVDTTEELNSATYLKTLAVVVSILKEIAGAGYEYEDVIKADTDLKDALAEVNLLLEQESSIRNTVFAGMDRSALDTIGKELAKIDALSNHSAEAVITALELAVDLSKPTGDVLLEAYNSMCEEGPEDLALQLRASKGPLTKLAIQALFNQNEGKEGKKHLFLEALVFVKMLLTPWSKEDPAHMEVKREIATILLEQNLLTALLQQVTFWAVEWNMSFGDCGDPALIALLALVRHFPHVLTDTITPDAQVVAFIRHTATQHRGNANRNRHESAGSACVILEALLDGLPEPVPVVIPGQGMVFGEFNFGSGAAFASGGTTAPAPGEPPNIAFTF